MGNTRKCKKCLAIKPIGNFPVVKGKNEQVYHTHDCKECRKEYGRKWRLANADKLKLSKKQYHIDNRNHILERVKKWQSENREYKIKYQKDWYEKNKTRLLKLRKDYYFHNQDKILEYTHNNRDTITARMKLWRKTNKEKLQEHRKSYYENNKEKEKENSKRYSAENPLSKRISEAKRRAQKNKSIENYDNDDVELLYIIQRGKCVYCQKDLTDNFEVDHMRPLSRGGSNGPDNIQLLCQKCNRSKWTDTHEEYLVKLGMEIFAD